MKVRVKVRVRVRARVRVEVRVEGKGWLPWLGLGKKLGLKVRVGDLGVAAEEADERRRLGREPVGHGGLRQRARWEALARAVAVLLGEGQG